MLYTPNGTLDRKVTPTVNAVSTNRRYRCPDWCEGHDLDSVETSDTTHEVVHCSGVGGGSTDRLLNMMSGQLYRDEQMTWDVACYLTEDSDGVRQGEFVHLDLSDLRDHTKQELRLTSGEARIVAAALIAAAERIDIVSPHKSEAFHRYTGITKHN